MRAELTQQILELPPGAHLCLLYDRDAEEQMPTLLPFLREGLSRNEQCIYVAADQTVEQLEVQLRQHEMPIENEVERGKLKLWTREQWRQPGPLDSMAKAKQVQSLALAAQADGFHGIRFMIEMGWVLDPDVAVAALEYWEATINTLFNDDFPVRIVCQYNRSRLSSEFILAALYTHPFVILEDEVCRNVFYQAPLILRGEGRDAAVTDGRATERVNWMISQLRGARAAERQTRALLQQQGAQERLALQWATTEIMSEAASFHEVGTKFLRQLCTSTGWDVGIFWSIDEESARLRCAELWQSPELRGVGLKKTMSAQTFACGAGLPGQVWLEAAPGWLDGFTREEELVRRLGHTPIRLRSACAFPIAIRHEVIGVIELFSKHPRARNPGVLEMLIAASAPVGSFFERQRAEQKQRSSEERLRQLVSLMPAGMYTCDAIGRITFYNRHAAELWGREPRLHDDRELYCGAHKVYRDDGRLVAPPLTPTAIALTTGKAIRNVQTVIERPDGVRFSSNESIDLIVDAAGKITGAINVFQDITELKRSENLLAGQNRALQRVISSAPLEEIFTSLIYTAEAESAGLAVAGILLVDADGRRLRHGAAPSLPDAYNAAIDGIEIAPNVGTCCTAAYCGEIVITPDIESEEGWSALKHLPLELGFRAAWSMPIMSSTGKVLGTFGTYFRECRVPSEREKEIVAVLCKTAAIAIERDRAETERKRTAREIEDARDQALAASRAKDNFLAALSHELRTPLNPVLLLASEAAQNEVVPEPWRTDFETIRKNVELEARLIDDLLDLTRITQDTIPMERCSVKAHGILEEALSTVRSDIAAKQIRLTLTLSDGEPLVWGDAAWLQQVFGNVLKNAVKFTPEGGAISVVTSIDAVSGAFITRIADTGIGITASELPRVFDPFGRGDHAEDGARGGSHRFGGLGLAISQKLVELHNGKISAFSVGRDRGSEFVIELPAMRKEAGDPPVIVREHFPEPSPKKARAAIVEEALPKGRILLVEDHAPTRTTLEHLLRRRHYGVLSAGSLREARALMETEGDITLIISDIGLPDGNGYELMTELRERHGLKGIALSGYGMESDISQSFSAGFNIHLIKPVCVRSLDEALRAVTER